MICFQAPEQWEEQRLSAHDRPAPGGRASLVRRGKVKK